MTDEPDEDDWNNFASALEPDLPNNVDPLFATSNKLSAASKMTYMQKEYDKNEKAAKEKPEESKLAAVKEKELAAKAKKRVADALRRPTKKEKKLKVGGSRRVRRRSRRVRRSRKKIE